MRWLYELGGIIGIDPGHIKPIGLLMVMAEGRQRHDWSLQSHLLAMIAGAFGDEDATPDRFNPFEHGEDESAEIISFAEARDLLRPK